MRDEFLFSEKYRPKKVSEIILPKKVKDTFQAYVDTRNVPNLLLVGGPGTGKTTSARAMLEELGADYIVVKGSLDAGIDVIRNLVTNFVSTVSFSGGRKYVIFDEADGLTQNVQQSLRNFIDSFTGNAGFIFTANYKNKIIEPIQSRCSVVDFRIKKENRQHLAVEFFQRLKVILDTENIAYDEKVLVQVISKYFPDWRHILNEIQAYSVNGQQVDSGILINFDEVSLKKLIDNLKSKNFTEIRKWVAENSDIDTHTILRKFYDVSSSFFKKESIPQLVLLINEYDYKSSFVIDHEINLTAFMIRVMVELEFV